MAGRATIYIGDWHFDASSNRLERGNQQVTLEPLPALVLEYLAARPNVVVGADELIEALWPRKFVGDSPVYRIVAELRRALGDDAHHPQYIETIRKRGYRLVAETGPIEINEAPAAAVDRSTASHGPSTKPILIGFSVALLAAAAAASYWFVGVQSEQPIQTIAVLPFEDLSADGNDEYLGDGIAEVLIHQLSQVDGLQVIARNSSFVYKGRNVDIREVGQTLGATNVLEGSVQRGDGTLRIAAQLIDAETGSHVWSKLFDVPDSDLFVVQDDIATTVTEELAPTAPEGAIESTANDNLQLDAYELYMLGRYKASNLDTAGAIESFRGAIDRDAGLGLAHAGLADALLEGIYLNSQSQDRASSLEDARVAIDRAIELAPERPEPYTAQLLLASIEGNRSLVDSAYENAIARDSTNIAAHVRYLEDLLSRAWLELNREYLNRAIAAAERAERLDPLNMRLKRNLARIARFTGAYDKADRLLRDMYGLAKTRGEAAQALGSLAFLYYDIGQYDKAVGYFHLARDYAGDDIGVYTTYLAHSYLLMQDYSSAQRWLNEIEKPYDIESLFVHWDMLLLSGDDSRLVSEIDAWLADENSGSIVPVDELRSLALFFLGNTGHCERLFEVAAQTDMVAERVRQPAGDCTLAYCYGVLGMEDKAQEHIRYARDYVRRVEENGMSSSVDLYVAATVFALENNREAALDTLEIAYGVNKTGADFLDRDLIMARYRDDERFQRILANMRANGAAMRKRVFRAEAENDWHALVDIEPLADLH